MKVERTISAYKNYFRDFISSLTEAEARKVFYVIDMLKTQFQWISEEIAKDTAERD